VRRRRRSEGKCCCLGVTGCTRLVGGLLLLLVLGLYVAYLVLIEDVRDLVLHDLYGVAPCSMPPIDTATDVAFEYSVLANLLLVFVGASCTRWLLLPWLVVHAGCVLLLAATGLLVLLVPVHQDKLTVLLGIDFQVYRCLGFLPIILAMLLLTLWVVIRSLFVELGESQEPQDTCCPLRLKTGVQIVGGVLAIISGVLLVVFFAKLDEVIAWRYRAIVGSDITRGALTAMAGLIVLAIMVNILVILGASGGRWRRALLLPWLLLYGAGTVACLGAHVYFTSLCWREEKVTGSILLLLAFLTLVLWSLVWLVAAQVTERPKALVGGHTALTFQRL